MAQTYVTTHTGGAAQSGLTATVSVVSATAGNHLRLNARVSSNGRSVVSVSGGTGNTWTDTGETPTDAASNNKQVMWYCENCAAGTYTVTITWDSSAATNVEAFIDEFSGTATSSSLDVHTSNGAAIGASPLSVGPSSATTNANDNIYTTGMSINGTNARPLTTPASYTTDHAGAVNAKATQFVSAHLNVTSTGTQTVSWAWTGGNSAVTGILAAFKDAAGGGPTSKTDTDSATLSEQVPQIAPTPQTDSATLSDTQTVTALAAKSSTDTATLTEGSVVPQIGTFDTATVDDSANTVVATDVIPAPDFTLLEGVPQIGLAMADAFSLSETQTLTASFIRFLDTDAFGVTDTQTTALHIADNDSLTVSEVVAPVIGRLNPTEAFAISETQTVVSSAPTTGYLMATMSVTSRLGGTLTAAPRLTGRQTVQPAGRP